MINKNRVKFRKKFEWILVLLAFYIIFSLSRSMWEFFGVSEKLDEVGEELVAEKKRSIRIEAETEQATSEAYIEKVARDKLNMQKEGETVVILPDDSFQLSEPGSREDEQGERGGPNWQKWWELIN